MSVESSIELYRFFQNVKGFNNNSAFIVLKQGRILIGLLPFSAL